MNPNPYALHPKPSYTLHVRALKRLYRGTGFVRVFLAFRWVRLLRAPYREIEEIVPRKGTIVDIGSGYGFFSNFLTLTSPLREVIGIEYDSKRTAIAPRGQDRVRFICGDVMNVEIPSCDAIVMIFMLHHLRSFEEQERLIARAYQALEPGGLFIMGEIDRIPRWKFFFSWVVDKAIYYKDTLHYRDEQGFRELLGSIGFSDIRVIPAHKGIPFSHKVYVGKK